MPEYIDREALFKTLKQEGIEFNADINSIILSMPAVNLSEFSGWVSVKDRLPEKAGSYLVTGKSGGAYVTHFYTANEIDKKSHFSSPYVTHWQERPEAPKRPQPNKIEVVLCKDCKHLYCCSAVDRQFYCRHHLGMKGCLNPIEEKPYCSYGERKESEGNYENTENTTP